ncbi:response regulator [Rhodovibrio salinarum]|uniref:Response regulator n=1 Tax=Rhodovibrio salinarum TaxID=1087 RepID=A0A934QIM1_9PROT|nr:response regulator [Rhodovibrio salinarum]MBK1697473.1 response regulator [Rhodovibrio salinarum]
MTTTPPNDQRVANVHVPVSRGPGSKGRVLLAESDPRLCTQLAGILRRAGFYVVAVHDGRRALVQLCDASFNLLVTDIVMPGNDGLDLLRWLRKMHPDVPALVLSGDGPEGGALYAKAAMCLGADVCVPKQAPLPNFLSAAHRLVSAGRLETPERRVRQPAA